MDAISDLPDLLRTKIALDGNCWVWTAAKDRHGYGKVRWDGKTRFAHRVIYALLAGDPGPVLDHLCRNPSCVRPAHLDPVTQLVNVRRGRGIEVAMANRLKWAEPRNCPQGHALVGDNLYVHFNEKRNITNRQCRTCRRESKQRRRAAGARD